MTCLNTYSRKHIPAVGSYKERGAVLIVSLVMLTILTIIAVATTTDIGLQSNMARNSQIRMNVFNLAHSELRSQFIFFNDVANRDQLLGEVQREQSAMDAAEIKNDAHINIVFEVDVPEDEQPVSSLVDGGALHSSAVQSMIFDFNAVATLPGTGMSSDQSIMVKLYDPNGINLNNY